MAKSGVIFVLWGERCEETLAVAWVSRLRAEGKRVYLVAVSGRRNRGRYGVALETDIGLDEAVGMAARASLVILPCAIDALNSFRRDPRFDELLVLAGQTGHTFLPIPPRRKLSPGSRQAL